MVSLRSLLIRATASLFVLILLGLETPGQKLVEPVAVLYAHDGNTLFRIDPDSGEFFTIGELSIPCGQMTYDARTRCLYATGVLQTPHGTPIIVRIDPKTAAEEIVWQGQDGHFSAYGIAYDPKDRELYVNDSEGTAQGTEGAVQLFDGSTGQFGAMSAFRGLPAGELFFDQHGHPWTYWGDDGLWELREFSGLDAGATELERIQRFYPFGGPVLPRPDWVPLYHSLSIHPDVPLVFAWGAPIITFFDGAEEVQDLDRNHRMLCIINLKTGQPQKVIATYDQSADPNFSLRIAWGIEP